MQDAPSIPSQKLNLCIGENGLIILSVPENKWVSRFDSLFKAFRFAETLSLFGNLRLVVSDGRGTVFYELTV